MNPFARSSAIRQDNRLLTAVCRVRPDIVASMPHERTATLTPAKPHQTRAHSTFTSGPPQHVRAMHATLTRRIVTLYARRRVTGFGWIRGHRLNASCANGCCHALAQLRAVQRTHRTHAHALNRVHASTGAHAAQAEQLGPAHCRRRRRGRLDNAHSHSTHTHGDVTVDNALSPTRRWRPAKQ